jgi:SAM-dependent methyltransferase
VVLSWEAGPSAPEEVQSVSEINSTHRHEIEQTLHDEFYSGLQFSDEKLMAACAPARLALYKANPNRDFVPKQYQFYLLGDLNGKVVCDYACGDGEDSVLLVGNGARKVMAFDISNEAVALTRRRAKLAGLEDRIEARQANAEKLEFESNLFDAIYGSSTLHHLDIEAAAREVRRVLKPGGKAVFREPYEDSRLLALASKVVFAVTPLRPDAVSPQRQLNRGDIRLLRSIFSRVHVRPFGLFNRIDRLIRDESLVMRVNAFDGRLMTRFPFLMSYARHIVIECIK